MKPQKITHVFFKEKLPQFKVKQRTTCDPG